MKMKTIILILFLFVLRAWAVETFNFEDVSIDDSAILEKTLADGYLEYLASYYTKEELKKLELTEEEFETMQIQLNFWRMMKQNYFNGIICFGNS